MTQCKYRLTSVLACILIFSLFIACGAQEKRPQGDRPVGGPCEGCEAALEYQGHTLKNSDTIPGYNSMRPRIHLKGTVYHKGGTDPAENVIIYLYHTDTSGLYTPLKNARGWASRHGQHRAWVRTDENGRYEFHTFLPGAYPGRRDPRHMHMTIKEPGLEPYYIDDILFEHDERLTAEERKSRPNRGGPGIVSLQESDKGFVITRDIYLGKNIPGY